MGDPTGALQPFGRDNPCPVCGRTNGKCKRTPRGHIVCRDADNTSGAEDRGFSYLGKCKNNPHFGLYEEDGAPIQPRDPDFDPAEARRQHEEARAMRLAEWTASIGGESALLPLDGKHGRDLAKRLKLPFDNPALEGCGARFVEDCRIGWGGPAFAFPLLDAGDKIVGYSLRKPGGFKMSVGTSNGIFAPFRALDDFARRAREGQPLFIPAGASSTLALNVAGLNAIGRCSDLCGVGVVPTWIDSHLPRELWDVVVVLENDATYDKQGKPIWPGRDNGLRAACQIADALGIVVRFVLPPSSINGMKVKDVRDWFGRLYTGKMTPGQCGVIMRSEMLRDAECINPGDPYRPRPIPASVLPFRADAPVRAAGGDGDSAAAMAAVTSIAGISDVVARLGREALTPEQQAIDDRSKAEYRAAREAESRAFAEAVRAEQRARWEALAQQNGTTPEHEEQHEAALEEAREAIREARRDQGRFPCRHIDQIVTRSKETEAEDGTGKPPQLTIIDRRCEREWGCDCPGCRAYLIERETITARFHFTQAELAGATLYMGRIGNDPVKKKNGKVVNRAWLQLHERIKKAARPFGWRMDTYQSGKKKGQQRRRRIRGQAWVVRDGDGFLVITDVDPGVEGFTPTTAEGATAAVVLRLEEHRGTSNPSERSHGWGAIDLQEETNKNELVGMVPDYVAEEQVEEITKGFDARTFEHWPNGPSTAFRFRVLWRVWGWDLATAKRFMLSLAFGRVLPEGWTPPGSADGEGRRGRRRRYADECDEEEALTG